MTIGPSKGKCETIRPQRSLAGAKFWDSVEHQPALFKNRFKLINEIT